MNSIEDIIDGFINFLTSKGQIGLLPEIVERLNGYLKEEKDFAYVSSVIALTSEEEGQISSFLKNKFGRDFKIKVKIDPKIGGGLIIRVKDQVIDQSLSGKLHSLTEQLKS